MDLILNESFKHSLQENLFINSICFPPSPLSTQGAMNKQGTCAHWTKTSHFLGGIHFCIVDKSLALYLFLLEQEQGTSAHSILLKGLLPFFLQKCKSSFRAHSCSLSMNNLYNFFLKKMLAHQFWPQLIVCNPSLSDCHLPKPEQRKGIWKACLHYNIVVRPWVQEVILRLDSRVFEVDRENDLKYDFMKKSWKI